MKRYFNTSLRNLAYRLRKFKTALPENIGQFMQDEELFITDCIREQLRQGVNGKGEALNRRHPYKSSTVKYKLWKGQSAFIVDLYDTGQFYYSLALAKDDRGFYIVSKDKIVKYLVAKYGPEILRLDNFYFNELVKRIRVRLQNTIRYGQSNSTYTTQR